MANTLDGPFAINRMEVPKFYTPLVPTAHGLIPGISVLAESDEHSNPSWITLGFVSAQTPLGQGIYMGFQRDQVTEAEPAAVVAALRVSHPHGRRFRPHCAELGDVEFNLIMSGPVRNWTNDDTGGCPPIINVSRQELLDHGREVGKTYRSIMHKWRKITRSQVRGILRSLEQHPVTG